MNKKISVLYRKIMEKLDNNKLRDYIFLLEEDKKSMDEIIKTIRSDNEILSKINLYLRTEYEKYKKENGELLDTINNLKKELVLQDNKRHICTIC